MNVDAQATYKALQEVQLHIPAAFPLSTVDGYVGERRGDEFHGEGTVASCMGFTYGGSIEQGQLSGEGQLRWVTGYSVRGSFKEGGVEGHGEMWWQTGDHYEGEVSRGARHGAGMLTSHNGCAVYDGDWVRGKRDGRGRQQYPEGDVYTGQWKVDQRHGYGQMFYRGGDCYEGEWKNGVRHGRGAMGWRKGGTQFVEVFDGEWCDGLPHGKGRSMYIRPLAAASPRKDGASEEGIVSPQGYAAPVPSVLNVYHGDFVAGVREGYGTFYYADGSCYEGQWVRGRKNGPGTFTAANGATFFGVFVDDEPQGVPNWKDTVQSDPVPEVYLAGMCGLTESNEKQLTDTIKALLLRFNSVLKLLFHTYASKCDEVALVVTTEDWWVHRIPGHLTIPQLLRLLSDASVLDGLVAISTVIRCVVQVIEAEAEAVQRDAARTAGEVAATYRFASSMNYRQFTEVLVRLAPKVCVGQTFSTLGQKFNTLMETYLTSPLLSKPLCPLSRSYAAAVVPQIAPLEKLFGRLVELETDPLEHFVPARRVVALIHHRLLPRYAIALGAVMEALFSVPRLADSSRALPGCNAASSDLGLQLFEKSCGPQHTSLHFTVSVERWLTLVDFIEMVVAFTDLVNRRYGVDFETALCEHVTALSRCEGEE